MNLQYGKCSEELAALRSASHVDVAYWPEAIADYDETAALVTALDLVISVQTAVVHLAGALGRPAWVLVPATPEWRYLQDGATMPWYPAVTLFRQQTRCEWTAVIAEVAHRLASPEAALRGNE